MLDIDSSKCATGECQLPDFTTLAACTTCKTRDIKWSMLSAGQRYVRVNATVGGKLEEKKDISIQEFDNLLRQAAIPSSTSNNDSVVIHDYGYSGSIRSIEYDYGLDNGFDDIYLEISVYPEDRGIATPRLEVKVFETPLSFGDFRFGNYLFKHGWNSRTNALAKAIDVCVGKHDMQTYSPAPLLRNSTAETITPYTCVTSTSDLLDLYQPAKLLNLTFQATLCNIAFCAREYLSPAIRNGTLIANTNNISLRVTSRNNATGDYTLTQDGKTKLVGPYLVGNNSQIELLRLAASAITTKGGSEGGYRFMDMVDEYGWPALFDILADASTALIRRRGNAEMKLVVGDAYGPETYMNVSWAWLAMPVALVFATTLFLALTATISAEKSYLFKTSLLAILFHGLDTQGSRQSLVQSRVEPSKLQELGQRETSGDLIKRSKKYKVRLGKDSLGELKIIKVD